VAWGSKTQISNAVTVNSTTLQDPSTAVVLDDDESAWVQVSCDFGASPTGDMEVWVQTTGDVSSETWDTSSYGAPIVIPNTTDPGVKSFTVSGVPKFRLQYKNSAGTTSNAVSAWYEKTNQ
jgi:hypothetical protein